MNAKQRDTSIGAINEALDLLKYVGYCSGDIVENLAKVKWRIEDDRSQLSAPERREISGERSIRGYMQCSKCLDERPDGISPQDFARQSVGFTDIGFQVWCNRHEINICHIDFQGFTHPANVRAVK